MPGPAAGTTPVPVARDVQPGQTTGGSGMLAAVTDTLRDAFSLVSPRYWLAIGVLLVGAALYLIIRRSSRRLLVRLGVDDFIEGTAFERTARDFGTTTVGLVAHLLGLFVFGVAGLVALTVAEVSFADPFWSRVAAYLPQLFLATLVVIAGIIVGDKAEVLVAERLQDVKLPEVGVVPSVAKYSVVYVALLVALSQLGVATLALVVLLAAYLFAFVVFAAIASYSLLSSSAAGAYLLLSQPYSIGDEVRVGDKQGIVQEMDLFVTHIESEGEEHIVPNRRVFEEGVVRIRQ
jgi:small-conductance mechanosensitive channel